MRNSSPILRARRPPDNSRAWFPLSGPPSGPTPRAATTIPSPETPRTSRVATNRLATSAATIARVPPLVLIEAQAKATTVWVHIARSGGVGAGRRRAGPRPCGSIVSVMTTFANPAALLDAVGTDLGVTDWIEITQDRIDRFADATGDHQWIHVDPERAAEGPFGATIAHGYLTLSLTNQFLPDCSRSRTSRWASTTA